MRLRKITEAADSVLECRAMGHAWTRLGVEDKNITKTRRGEIKEADLGEVCLRCGSPAYRHVNFITGEISPRRTKYVDGYLAAKGVHIKRSDAIFELYNRTLTQQ